jgi:acyl-coenzyme A thioesterase PaaI-like protein
MVLVATMTTSSQSQVGDTAQRPRYRLPAFAEYLGVPDTVTTTIESKTNFLAAGRGAYLTGDSTPLHIGRNTMVWQTTIRDAEDRRVGS